MGMMRIRIAYRASQVVTDAAFTVDIHRDDGVYCAEINTLMTSLSVAFSKVVVRSCHFPESGCCPVTTSSPSAF
jgi:competence transcription factor ComK